METAIDTLSTNVTTNDNSNIYKPSLSRPKRKCIKSFDFALDSVDDDDEYFNRMKASQPKHLKFNDDKSEDEDDTLDDDVDNTDEDENDKILFQCPNCNKEVLEDTKTCDYCKYKFNFAKGGYVVDGFVQADDDVILTVDDASSVTIEDIDSIESDIESSEESDSNSSDNDSDSVNCDDIDDNHNDSDSDNEYIP